MKKTFLTSILSLLLLCGCNNEKDITWDIYPVEAHVHVTDQNGTDLLNPANPNHINISEVKAIYNDKEYTCSSNLQPPTRYYMPVFYGLKLVAPDENRKTYLLSFGELDGAENYKDETITLVWPNGSRDVLKFDHTYKIKSNEPVITHQWYLNGTPYMKDVFTIVK